MNELKLLRMTGLFGLATVLLWLSQLPLYMQGDPTVSIYDGAGSAREMFQIRNVVFTRILLNLCAYVTGMVFAAGFSQLIRRARPACEWVGSLVFGSFVVWLAVTLVANGLEGAAALNTLRGTGDASAVRALLQGTILIYNGSIAFAITGLFLGAVGYATFATGVVPRWTGWVAYLGAALCALAIPAIYGGPVDWNGFYNAGGWGLTIVANFLPALWFVVANVSLLRARDSSLAEMGQGGAGRAITGQAA